MPDYVTIEELLSSCLELTSHDSTIMKAFAKKLANKFKRPKHTVVSNTGSAVTSSLAESMPSAPAGSATQVIEAADATVGVQLSLSHQLYWHNFSIIVIDQTAQLGTSAPVTSSLADSMPPAPAGSATISAEVIEVADITVSVQFSLSHQLYQHNFSIIVVDQTTQLGTSALVTDDIASVAHVEERPSTLPFLHDNIPYNPSVSCFQSCFLAFAND